MNFNEKSSTRFSKLFTGLPHPFSVVFQEVLEHFIFVVYEKVIRVYTMVLV